MNNYLISNITHPTPDYTVPNCDWVIEIEFIRPDDTVLVDDRGGVEATYDTGDGTIIIHLVFLHHLPSLPLSLRIKRN